MTAPKLAPSAERKPLGLALEVSLAPPTVPLIDLGIITERQLSAFDGVLGFICGCYGRYGAVPPYASGRQRWEIEISHACLSHPGRDWRCARDGCEQQRGLYSAFCSSACGGAAPC